MRKDVLEDAASQFVACTAGSSGMTRLETFSTHVTVLRFGCGGRPPPRLASAWCGQLRYLRWLARPGTNATSLDISIHLAKTQARTGIFPSVSFGIFMAVAQPPKPGPAAGRSAARSEERRVGKECRSRWGRYQ